MSTFKINKGVVDNLESSLSGKSSTDLDNLSQTGEAHFANSALSNSPYTTNRILEIPQDIKLELNDGVLTLKAGSKVYVPNGFEEDGTTPKFDVVVIESDLSIAFSNTTNYDPIMICLKSDGTALDVFKAGAACLSGTSPATYSFYYHTDLNKLYDYEGDVNNPYAQVSFPLGLFKWEGSNGVTKIHQVFNGFGYIGSTVFALPGVKVQTTFERNTDGTYKSEIWSIQSVLTKTRTNSGADLQWYIQKNISDGTTAINALLHYYSSSTIPSTGPTYSLIWCEEDGGWYSTGSTGTATKLADYYFLKVFSSDSDSTGKISNFKNCSVDSIANTNASNFSQAGRSYLSGIGMPSSRYVDLTLGTSGSQYTAPANGYMSLQMSSSSASYSYCSLANLTSGSIVVRCFAYTANAPLRVVLPARRGDVYELTYVNATGTRLRFVYAEGEIDV